MPVHYHRIRGEKHRTGSMGAPPKLPPKKSGEKTHIRQGTLVWKLFSWFNKESYVSTMCKGACLISTRSLPGEGFPFCRRLILLLTVPLHVTAMFVSTGAHARQCAGTQTNVHWVELSLRLFGSCWSLSGTSHSFHPLLCSQNTLYFPQPKSDNFIIVPK